jgi:hypothetical protein
VSRTVPACGGWYQWGERGKEVRKGCGKVNIVQILCTRVYKWKNDSRNGEKGR